MCKDMNDSIDAIHEVRDKISPILSLMRMANEINPNPEEIPAKEELGSLGWLLSLY